MKKSRTNRLVPGIKKLVIALAFVSLAGCGGSSSDGSSGGSGCGDDCNWSSYGGVTIGADSDTVELESLAFGGDGGCPHCPAGTSEALSCPAISCPGTGGIEIRWHNRSTGVSGVAAQIIRPLCGCLFSYCISYCAHSWQSPIPLGIGENRIEVEGLRNSSQYGRDRTKVVRLPAQPTDVAVVSRGTANTLSWTDTGNADSYNIYWSTSRNFRISSATRIENAASPYLHSDLAANETYYYMLTAVKDGYESRETEPVWATVGWTVEPIAQLSETTDEVYAAMALDSGDGLHVFYGFDADTDSGAGGYYATRSADAWISESVLAEISADIAVDSNDTVHIGIQTGFGSNSIRSLVSGIWKSNVFDVVFSSGYCHRLEFDVLGNAHAISGYNGDLFYATNATGSWQAMQMPTTNSNCEWDLLIDALGDVHVVYADAPAGSPDFVTHAWFSNASWNFETIADSGLGSIDDISAALDSLGQLHVAITNSQGEISYSYQDWAGWHTETVLEPLPPEYLRGGHASIEIDSNDLAYIAFIERGERELRMATRSDGAWSSVPVARANRISNDVFDSHKGDTGIVIDSGDKVHVAFFDGIELKLATH